MVKLQFHNATVIDYGYGVEVNGKSLNTIISTALGTKAGNNYGYDSGLLEFRSNCCNVTVIIEPQPVFTRIETDEHIWESIAELEEGVRKEYEQAEKIKETAPEE